MSATEGNPTAAALQHRGLGALEVHACLGSTEDRVRALLARGSPAPILVVAERQTEGRGRGGRGWSSPRGGLWFSLGLRRAQSSLPAAPITIPAALAAARAIEATTPGIRIGLKWPNDLFIDDRKVGGLLASVEEGGRAFVLGVGLNLDVDPRDLPPEVRAVATSLRQHTRTAPSPTVVLCALLDELDPLLAAWSQGAYAPLLAEAWERSILRGRSFGVIPPAGAPYRARATGLDEIGRLCVERLDDGTRHALISARIQLRDDDDS